MSEPIVTPAIASRGLPTVYAHSVANRGSPTAKQTARTIIQQTTIAAANFAALRMNHGIQQALAGKNIETV